MRPPPPTFNNGIVDGPVASGRGSPAVDGSGRWEEWPSLENIHPDRSRDFATLDAEREEVLVAETGKEKPRELPRGLSGGEPSPPVTALGHTG
jgi:hypothetical protein